MATAPFSRAIEHIRAVAARYDATDATDAQLLEAFINRRDEAAFEGLVRRHGPMVLGVCRRMLRDAHDAEDAFQATFLVLARKAATVQPRAMVGNWLFGVARMTGLRARGVTARRRTRERQVMVMPEPAAPPAETDNEWQPLLDQALSSLPEKYRILIVLCELEGKTRRAAARQLALPEGTVASRLARARALLAQRLKKHGLLAPPGFLASALAASADTGALPAGLVGPVIKAAQLFAAGQTTNSVSTQVFLLAEGVLKAMLLAKLKTMLSAVLAIGFLAIAGVMIHRPEAQAQSGEQPLAHDTTAPQSLRATILALEAKTAQAGDQQDIATLKKYTAPDFRGMVREGFYTRADMLDGLKKYRFSTRWMKDIQLLVVGPDVVVLTYKAGFARSTPNREEVVLSTRYVASTWARRGGRWVYVFSSQTIIPDAPPEDLALPAIPNPNIPAFGSEPSRP